MANEMEKKILILDFDTQFTALKANGCLSPAFYESDGPEIFLPKISFLFEIVDKIIESSSLKHIIILDSLNGLMDYFTSKLIHNKKNFQIVETLHTSEIDSQDKRANNSVGHLALLLLKILFVSPRSDNMSIIVTSYLAQGSLENLRSKFIYLESDSLVYDTHFERLASSIAVLEYEHERKSLFYTRILNQKNFPDKSSVLDYPRLFEL